MFEVDEGVEIGKGSREFRNVSTTDETVGSDEMDMSEDWVSGFDLIKFGKLSMNNFYYDR